MTINNVKVETVTNVGGYVSRGTEDTKTKYYLKLTIPLPGGEAIYSFELTKGQLENLNKASELAGA